MLRDLPEDWRERRPSFLRDDVATSEWTKLLPEAQRLAQGIYLTYSEWRYDLHWAIESDSAFDDPMREWFQSLPPAGETVDEARARHDELIRMLEGPQDFGVCDHWSQILETWPELETDPRPFVIRVSPVHKFEQPAYGGWRWHKWGRYIGTKEPKHEYLADEGPEFETVWLFSIYQLKEDL